jgi:5-methyltetrahydrofolate--homocysteine methyltransferase
MPSFLEALQSGAILLMDGAMGTELQRADAQQGVCFELWNRTHPERIKAVHESYARAGARVLLTNTFQANPRNLAKHGAAERVEEIFRAGIGIARSVSGPDGFVLTDVGPIENVDAATASHIIDASVSADAVLLETWSDPSSIPVFADAISRLPLLVSFTFWRPKPDADLCTFAGFSPEACVRSAQGSAVAAIGINCGRGLTANGFLEIIRRYRALTELPLFARPNAGLPRRVGDRWVYPDDPKAMALRLPAMLEAGVRMVGGCCGTTPEHIRAFRDVVDEWMRAN